MNSLLAFVVVILLVVGLHEGGHFLAGKWLGFKILRFSIGIGPVIFKKMYHGTEYCLSCLPLGGYVRFFDENDPDYAQSSASEQAQAFERQPRWKQAIVLAAGVAVNFVCAWLCFVCVSLFAVPVPSNKMDTPLEDTPLAQMGAVTGSRLLAINGESTPHFAKILRVLEVNTQSPLTLEVQMPSGDRVTRTIEASCEPWTPATMGFAVPTDGVTIERVMPEGPSARVGLQPQDIVLSINQEPIHRMDRFGAMIQAWQASHPGVGVPLEINRDGVLITLYPTPNEEGKIGVAFKPRYDEVYVQLSFGEALMSGWRLFWRLTKAQLEGLAELAMPGPSKHEAELVGPVRLAQAAGQASQSGLQSFLFFIGGISVAIGWLNLLPIPVLDGGRLVILGVEGLISRRLPQRLRVALFAVGAAVLLMVMVLAIGLDVKALWEAK